LPHHDLRGRHVPLRELVRVAGRRWAVEASFQVVKGLAGLDENQVRRWTSWRRWTLLSMVEKQWSIAEHVGDTVHDYQHPPHRSSGRSVPGPGLAPASAILATLRPSPRPPTPYAPHLDLLGRYSSP
jgi:hypothetical protein